MGLLAYSGLLPRAGAAILTGQDEHSSHRLATLASRALQDPGSLTHEEIRSLAGSVLTQAPDRK